MLRADAMQTLTSTELPSLAEFRGRYQLPRQPVVLKGVVERWPLERLADFDAYRERYGDVTLPLRTENEPERQTSVADYIARLQRGEPPRECGYLAQVHMGAVFPDFTHEADFPRYWWRDRFANLYLWMGPSGTRTLLHCDFADNLIAQVVGRKRFVLYRPSAAARIPRREKTYASCTADLDFDSPLPDEPDFEVILEAGEMLYLPPGWWHYVESLERSITVTLFWWTPRTLASSLPRFVFSRYFRKRLVNWVRRTLLRRP